MLIPLNEVLLGFVVTAVLTGVIGLERQRRNKSAGITTHMILGVSTFAVGVLQRELSLTSIAFLLENP